MKFVYLIFAAVVAGDACLNVARRANQGNDEQEVFEWQ